MSRIEEALRRAREAESTGALPVPPVEVFHDPWALGDADAPQPEPAARVAETVATGEVTPQAPADRAAAESRPAAAEAATLESLAGLALFQGFSPTMAEKIVATPDIRPTFAEQYRKLAASLRHAQLNHGLKVLMVTSAMAGEGKSLTATNLALTFSESYRRTVLLVDADLRRPTLHETFRVPNVSGLGDSLRSETEEKLPLVQVSPRLTDLTTTLPQ